MIDEQKQRNTQKELEKALASIISGFIPICSQCKSIRDANGSWTPVENYISQKSKVQFSHGMCPACAREIEEDILKSAKDNEEHDEEHL